MALCLYRLVPGVVGVHKDRSKCCLSQVTAGQKVSPSRFDVGAKTGVFCWEQACVLVPCVCRAFALRNPPFKVSSVAFVNGKLFWVCEDVLFLTKDHVEVTQHNFKERMS